MGRDRSVFGVVGLLAFATPAMAGSINYFENWNDFSEWSTVSGMSAFPTDPSKPPGWGGQNLKCASPGWDSGITNDLNDGSHGTDPLTAGEFVGPKAGSPITLSGGYRVFKDKAVGAVNWEMVFSGPSHSFGMRAAGGLGDAGTSDVYEYSIDGSAWADTTVSIIENASSGNMWDGIWLEVGTTYLKVGAAALGTGHPGTTSQTVATGTYSDWMFDTITIKSFDTPTTRAGYFAAITLTGEVVPEPASLALLCFGCLVLVRRRR